MTFTSKITLKILPYNQLSNTETEVKNGTGLQNR